MIVLLNGAFGVGKTAVARALVSRLPRAILFDPELVGVPLQRAARLTGRAVPDFQDLALWRRLTVLGVRGARLVARNVVVPMAFSNPEHLNAIRRGAEKYDGVVHHFCLIAPEDVVHARLRARGADPAQHAWQYRRASECCAVHGDAIFATHIRAADRSPEELALDILSVVGGQ